MEKKKKVTLLEAMKHFESLTGEPPNDLEYWGVRTSRSPKGETKIHITAVPFLKDGALAQLAAAAMVEGEPLSAFVLMGDPDEGLESMLDGYGRKIGTWNVNPYENVLITTFHPKCRIKTDLANAPPQFKALVEYIEKHYLLYDDLPEWGKLKKLIKVAR